MLVKDDNSAQPTHDGPGREGPCWEGPARAAVVLGEAGVDLSNTPPSTSHTWYSGIDTLHVSFGVKWGEGFEEMCARLEAAKLAAAVDEPVPSDHHVYIGGYLYNVRARGAGQGMYMPYVLESGGVVVLLNRKAEPVGETPNVRIEVGSLACLVQGNAGNLVQSVRNRIAALGGTVDFEKVSRLDIFADVSIRCTEFCASFLAKHRITRARKADQPEAFGSGHEMDGVPTGFNIGAGATRLRVYDKLRELNHDPVKQAAYRQLEWLDAVPKHVTRVEFQLRREALKEAGIDSLVEMLKALRPLAVHLSTSWFRLTDGTVKNNNRSRVGVAQCWQQVQAVFRDGFDHETPERFTLDRRTVDTGQLAAQALGVLETMLAIRGITARDLPDMLQKAGTFLAQHCDAEGRDVCLNLRAKGMKLEAKAPVERVSWSRG